MEDDGTVRGITQAQLDASVETLVRMAEEINADATVIRQRDGLVYAPPPLPFLSGSRWGAASWSFFG